MPDRLTLPSVQTVALDAPPCHDRWGRDAYSDLGQTPWWMDDAPAGTQPPRVGLATGIVRVYLAAVAAAVRDGDAIDLPHLGRLTRTPDGAIQFAAHPSLTGEPA